MSKPVLSIDLDSAAQFVSVPFKCLEGIQSKAAELISTENAIVPTPGQDLTARMVLSYSRLMPSLVTPKKGGDFGCDSNCANWKTHWGFVPTGGSCRYQWQADGVPVKEDKEDS